MVQLFHDDEFSTIDSSAVPSSSLSRLIYSEQSVSILGVEWDPHLER